MEATKERRFTRPRQKNHAHIAAPVLLLSSLLAFNGCAVLGNSTRPAQLDAVKEFTNSIGIKLVRIEPGRFVMGDDTGGDWDERPAHTVNITQPFYMGATEVTNAQYEQFDPWHRHLRGRCGLSIDPDEAVIFVSWEDAAAFCKWLSEKEGRPYRLPTEAEWEYACRAGTTTAYYTGDKWPSRFHKNQRRSKTPAQVGLHVARTVPNAWGLYDMHGNVEEWCHDWYGPYDGVDQTDPVGRVDGHFRICRGGSHNTTVRYLRSANRMGLLPGDRQWLTGFRIVMGRMPKGKPLPEPRSPRWSRNVNQTSYEWPDEVRADKSYFIGPKVYVKITADSNGPMFSRHNHDPALTWCENGDMLAIWYSCKSERGRELCVLASRLRRGAEEWEQAAPFWDAPDRNDHAPGLLNDGKGRLLHFNGLSAGAGYRKNLALVMRVSADNGATWSKARLINPVRGIPNQPIASTFVTQEGFLVVPCDWPWHEDGRGTGLWISRDGGLSWEKPQGRIAGIHAGVTQLRDGRFIALGRGSDIRGRMPMSISADMGRSWIYEETIFPPIGGGQRLVLLRVREGPLFLASFARDMTMTWPDGHTESASGLFGALSFDRGRSWPVRRLITDAKPAHQVQAMDGREFTMGPTSAEPAGYMAGVQTPDGIIHLVSSKQYYAFNIAWLKQAGAKLEF